MGKIIKKLRDVSLPDEFTKIDIIILTVVLLVCYLTFQHEDLYHTSTLSYGFLNGHFFDFYTYNSTTFNTGSDYLYPLYFLLAIWNVPLKLFRLIGVEDGIFLSVPELAWTKLFLVVCYIATVIVVYKIALQISQNVKNSKIVALVFASNPIAVFSVFCFGAYDVIGMLFVLVGFYFYITENWKRFIIFFTIAIPFKFFALIPFVPLLLLKKKKLLDIIKYGAISVAPTVLLFALATWDKSHSDIESSPLRIAVGKASGFTLFGLSPFIRTIWFVVLFSFLCMYAYVREIDSEDKQAFCKNAVFVTLFAYVVLFATITWHPQWVIYTTPFFALALLFYKNTAFPVLADSVGAIAFFCVVMLNFPNNVDTNMVHFGLLRDFFTDKYLSLRFGVDILYSPMTFFIPYLFFPFLMLLFEKLNKTKDNLQEDLFTQRIGYIRTRFLVGFGFWFVPAILLLFFSHQVAAYTAPDFYSSVGTHESEISNIVPLPFTQNIFEQEVHAELDGLYKISFRIGTYQRTNNNHINLKLIDESGAVVHEETVAAAPLADNAQYDFTFGRISNSKDKLYKLIVTSPDADDSNFEAIWGCENIEKFNNMYVNGNLSEQKFAMKILYN